VLHGPASATLRLVPGSTLSLLALHGPCVRVTLTGARWTLDKFDLEPLVGMGVSNEVPDADGPVDVDVTLSGGVLTIFDDPAADDPAADDPAMSETAVSGDFAHREDESEGER
jgi:hypothetical protein